MLVEKIHYLKVLIKFIYFTSNTVSAIVHYFLKVRKCEKTSMSMRKVPVSTKKIDFDRSLVTSGKKSQNLSKYGLDHIVSTFYIYIFREPCFFVVGLPG